MQTHAYVEQFMPQPKGEAMPFEAHREIFTSVAMFGGIVEMVLCDITVPNSFFVLLNKLPRLRRLSVRQAIIPTPPETLSSPPPLESLILAFLTPCREYTYSAYFLHLFPSTLHKNRPGSMSTWWSPSDYESLFTDIFRWATIIWSSLGHPTSICRL
ncbi:hypothetical protein HMN09_01265100 [Mycena chlorophos]|uniref:Uncharacterized protein n=1 Tax=Mycena chlorophos TaxID=658473 RepID=A0A8H6S2Y5_MYCCL|nr:hypothetical protein HMN09_01265100 [Mycena chlorophos]